MNEQQLKDLLNAIGATAEMTVLFHENLIKRGMSIGAATAITCAFVQQIIPKATGKGDVGDD